MSILKTSTVAKPWGCIELPAPFINPGRKPIGEIWFEPPPALDTLLVKYIFTSEALSVQCHPSDSQTLSQGLGQQGKEECWLVLHADPGARLGVGFDKTVDASTMRKAALDGSIEHLLVLHPVAPGDFFYIPANTVHAIGAGICLIELQQNSDITYRLFDYGRQRELHLDQGLTVARGEVHGAQHRKRVPTSGQFSLVDGPLFRLDRLDGPPNADARKRYGAQPLLVIPLDCTVTFPGWAVEPGQCAFADSMEAGDFPETGKVLIAQPL
jgi:mannose-6-phosphate isomerase